MFNWNARVFETPAIVPDDSAPIDHILDERLVERIYAAWDEEVMEAPIDYGGGVRAITVMMVSNAGEEFLVSIKGIGPKRAQEIMNKMSGVVSEVPYL